MQMAGQIDSLGSIVMTDGAEARPGKEPARPDGVMHPYNALVLLYFLKTGGPYWVTTRQSRPEPLSLAQAVWPSPWVANGPTRTR
jgi:hypothetical protein